MIVALAGRRVDAPDAKVSRFPARNIALVRRRIRTLFEDARATTLVSSAACGADLIALSEAGRLGLRLRVILPFERRRFRQSSVVDRPGEWGLLFDQIIDDADAAANLMTLNNEPGSGSYSAANVAILDEAVELSKTGNQSAVAVLVWDCVSRGDNDLTEQFSCEAKKRNLPIHEVMTL